MGPNLGAKAPQIGTSCPRAPPAGERGPKWRCGARVKGHWARTGRAHLVNRQSPCTESLLCAYTQHLTYCSWPCPERGAIRPFYRWRNRGSGFVTCLRSHKNLKPCLSDPWAPQAGCCDGLTLLSSGSENVSVSSSVGISRSDSSEAMGT